MAVANSEKSGDKAKALTAALGQIERQFGKGSIMRMGDAGIDQLLQDSDEIIRSMNALFPQENGLLRGVLKTGMEIIKRSGNKKKQKDPNLEYMELNPKVQHLGRFDENVNYLPYFLVSRNSFSSIIQSLHT